MEEFSMDDILKLFNERGYDVSTEKIKMHSDDNGVVYRHCIYGTKENKTISIYFGDYWMFWSGTSPNALTEVKVHYDNDKILRYADFHDLKNIIT